MIASHSAVLGQGRILFLGDSLTEGLWWNTACGDSVVNAGLGGAGAAGLLTYIEPILAAARPSVVVVMIGVNDATREAPGQPANQSTVENFAPRLSQLLDAIVASRARAAILTILPVEKAGGLGDAYFDSNAIRQFNAVIRAEAQARGLPLVDAYIDFAGPDGFMHAGWSIDGVHLYGAPGNSPNRLLYDHFVEGARQARKQLGLSCP